MPFVFYLSDGQKFLALYNKYMFFNVEFFGRSSL